MRRRTITFSVAILFLCLMSGAEGVASAPEKVAATGEKAPATKEEQGSKGGGALKENAGDSEKTGQQSDGGEQKVKEKKTISEEKAKTGKKTPPPEKWGKALSCKELLQEIDKNIAGIVLSSSFCQAIVERFEADRKEKEEMDEMITSLQERIRQLEEELKNWPPRQPVVFPPDDGSKKPAPAEEPFFSRDRISLFILLFFALAIVVLILIKERKGLHYHLSRKDREGASPNPVAALPLQPVACPLNTSAMKESIQQAIREMGPLTEKVTEKVFVKEDPQTTEHIRVSKESLLAIQKNLQDQVRVLVARSEVSEKQVVAVAQQIQEGFFAQLKTVEKESRERVEAERKGEEHLDTRLMVISGKLDELRVELSRRIEQEKKKEQEEKRLQEDFIAHSYALFARKVSDFRERQNPPSLFSYSPSLIKRSSCNEKLNMLMGQPETLPSWYHKIMHEHREKPQEMKDVLDKADKEMIAILQELTGQMESGKEKEALYADLITTAQKTLGKKEISEEVIIFAAEMVAEHPRMKDIDIMAQKIYYRTGTISSALEEARNSGKNISREEIEEKNRFMDAFAASLFAAYRKTDTTK